MGLSDMPYLYVGDGMGKNAIPVLPPVTAIIRYRRDVEVVRRWAGKGVSRSKYKGHPKRGKVTRFSRRSRQRLIHVAYNTSVEFHTMVTVTYPARWPGDGRVVKKHLRALLAYFRRHWAEPEYLWFLEFQRRGAPHIHIILDAKCSRDDYDAVALAWYRIVASGDERHRRAGTRVERLRHTDARYAVKYAAKMRQKRVPANFANVGRLWGHSSGVAPRKLSEIELDEKTLRIALEEWGRMPPEGSTVYKRLYGAAEYIERLEKRLEELGVDNR